MIIDSRAARRAMSRGFSLAEVTLALVLLGIAAAGVMLPFSSGVSVQAEGRRMTLAGKLANDLMERIVATGPDEIINTWDGYAEAQGQVTDAAGVVFADPAYAPFSRSAACRDDVYVSQQYGPPLPPDFLLVSVQVHYQGRSMVALSRLISK
jgi:prepilin-type N-terminal cleavage/methylation domain-containing protein